MPKTLDPKSEYVVGLMFDEQCANVLLLQKQRPDWQVGKLNGIGGKVESDETLHQAMAREFKEETGIQTIPSRWRLFCTLKDARGWSIHFFYTIGYVAAYDDLTDEEPIIAPLSAIATDPAIIPNLRWLIPMALTMTDESIERFEVVEVGQ